MRIGFISDIHEDIVRLEIAHQRLTQAGVDEIVCLGDIVGYSVPYYGYLGSRDANAVVDFIHDRCTAVVVGNHDLYAARAIPNHRSFFAYPPDWYEIDYFQRREMAQGLIHLYENNELPHLLSKKNANYLRTLPEFVIKDCGDHNILLSHYGYPDCTGSATAEIRQPHHAQAHLDFIASHGCAYGFSGNDHWEGFQLFTTDAVKDVPFLAEVPLDGVSWLHGPAVAFGTTRSGVMIYDGAKRTVTSLCIADGVHRVPASI